MRRTTSYLASVLLLVLVSVGAGPLPAQSPAEEVEITIQVSPQTLLLNWKAQGDVRVTVHAEVDYGLFVGADVEIKLGDIIAESIKPDARGDLVAKFPFDQVWELLEEGSVTLTLTAKATDGNVYTGTDVVRVIDR